MANIADKIKTAQDKDGMLRRALERIIQLYTDKSHFVYELLQNAEDAEAKSIKFVQYPDRLEVFHDGKPFTSANLQGLCDIGKSDKVDNLNQIGEFGVGFKSVFGICDTVRLYSSPSAFRDQSRCDEAEQFAVEIVDFTRPEDIQDEDMDHSYTTRFVFPYVVGKTFSGFDSIENLNKTLSSKLQNLGITTLLFMKNLEIIEYQIRLDDSIIEGEYLLEKKIINDHCTLVSAIGVGSQENKDEEISYLKFSRAIDVGSPRTVDIAFPVSIKEDGTYECQKPKSPYVSVYFPTETESKLDFIVQGPYRTTPNRSSIPADDVDNKKLASITAMLLKDSIIELRNDKKLNMSFVKALPIDARVFQHYSLFEPLYSTVKILFSTLPVIPCKNGEYVTAKCAKIARQDKLAALLTDELLSRLVNDNQSYHWLPTFLTETNREYEICYRYLTTELRIPVIRPEDLRSFFAANPSFLPKQSDNWLVELYSILENVGAAFSKAKYENNMLTADIIKTSTGKFVSAYRKTENKQYLPNVFLPSDKIQSTEIFFVDKAIYERCRHFFDDILQLQKPNEYEYTIKDIRKRYETDYSFKEDQHIDDIKHILKYIKYDDYRDEVSRLIKDCFVVKCNDGKMRSTHSARVFLPINAEGINIEGYYRNVINTISYVDTDFYTAHGLSFQDLSTLGVKNSILVGTDVVQGTYEIGGRGRQPEWWTAGEFRWKLSLDAIRDVLKYISQHSGAKDSMLKSQAIFRTLLSNEDKLTGQVRIGGSTPNIDNALCDLVRILRGEMLRDWNGKWLFTESGELVSQKDVSKHDISVPLYGRIKSDSFVYDLLGFRKTEADEVDDLKKTIPQKQLDAFFENELRQRFGISSAELTDRYGKGTDIDDDGEPDIVYPFPVVKVKNWEALKKHAAEMLIFADPVKYDYAVRRIRVSNHDKEAKAYLHNMYRYDGVYKYACQMCHESCSSVEKAQLFNNPEAELDPMNLCLCPNCATVYKQLRYNDSLMDRFKGDILAIRQSEVSDGEQVVVPLDSHEIWFAQTHFAEIQELIKLSEQVKNGEKEEAKAESAADEGEKEGLSVYSGWVGKQITRKTDGFTGTIAKIDNDYIYVKRPNIEKLVQIQLSFVLKNNGVYKIF